MGNSDPSEKERKLWKVLKEVRRRQAMWRSQERTQWTEQVKNPDGLSEQILRRAAEIYVSLKERRCSYGDYVFNFAFTQNNDIEPIEIPRELPKIVWSLGEKREKSWPAGIPMLRVDAIRQSDNSIRIIELNTNWVDNIAALAAFYEIYGLLPNEKGPIETLAEAILRGQGGTKGGNLALLYMWQTVGCKKDEIYSLADRLKTTQRFKDVIVGKVGEIDMDKNGLLSLGGKEINTIYLNGSWDMESDSMRERRGKEIIIKAVESNLVTLAPAQFGDFSSKESLIPAAQEWPSLFVKTTGSAKEALNWRLPVLAKPVKSESLKGVKVINTKEQFLEIEGDRDYVFQPEIASRREGIICVDSKLKSIFQPREVFEKINLWVMEEKVVGAMACYSPTLVINDAGYNKPIGIKEI